jgi:hypothetical protein
MADELDAEERALLEQHRAEKKKKNEEEKEVWIKQGDNEASVPYSKARKWLQESFGIDLDQEPVQGESGEGASPGQPQQGGQDGGARRFAGRRVG